MVLDVETDIIDRFSKVKNISFRGKKVFFVRKITVVLQKYIVT